MKSVKKIPLLLLLGALFFVTSCNDDGSPGPAGEKGDKGDKGEPGAGGGDGPDIIYSEWKSIRFTAEEDNSGYYAGIGAPQITPEILSTGDVRVYINLTTPGDPTISPLPYEADNSFVQFVASVGNLELYSNINASTFTDRDNNAVRQYRYVIIPSTLAGRKSQDINWNEYAEVKAYLNLAD